MKLQTDAVGISWEYQNTDGEPIMNKAFMSLIVLGAVALTSPAFAKTASVAAPVKGAKIAVSKTTSKVAAPLKHKHSKCSIKKTK